MSLFTLRNQKVTFRGRLLIAGLIATGVIGGGITLNEFNSAGAPSTNVTVLSDFVNAFVTATGSTSIKYPAVCIANPLAGLSLGTGAVVRLSYQNGINPAAIGGDIGFVKSCGDSGGSGETLINNTCTGTGCVNYYTTGTALWNGVDFIKLTLRNNPTSSYTARIRLQYEDVFGE